MATLPMATGAVDRAPQYERADTAAGPAVLRVPRAGAARSARCRNVILNDGDLIVFNGRDVFHGVRKILPRDSARAADRAATAVVGAGEGRPGLDLRAVAADGHRAVQTQGAEDLRRQAHGPSRVPPSARTSASAGRRRGRTSWTSGRRSLPQQRRAPKLRSRARAAGRRDSGRRCDARGSRPREEWRGGTVPVDDS